MPRFNYDKASKSSQMRSQGSERNTLLPGGEGEDSSSVDPNYVPKPSNFEQIAKRVQKLLKSDPGPKFVDRIKPFSIETKKTKRFKKPD